MPGADAFSLQWDQFGGGVAAVGALGLAAFGIVESLGKAFAFTYRLPWGTTLHHWGLPYVGLGAVRKMARPFRAALLCAYGDEAAELVAQQYQAGRGAGSAPVSVLVFTCIFGARPGSIYFHCPCRNESEFACSIR